MGFPLQYSLLRHEGHPQKEDHFDLVIERNESGRLDKFELFTDALDLNNLNLQYFGDVRRRYLHFEGEMDNNRGVISQIGSGTVDFFSSLGFMKCYSGPLKGTYCSDLIDALTNNSLQRDAFYFMRLHWTSKHLLV